MTGKRIINRLIKAKDEAVLIDKKKKINKVGLNLLKNFSGLKKSAS